jgi:hypothetical protein
MNMINSGGEEREEREGERSKSKGITVTRYGGL